MSKPNIEAKKERHRRLYEGHYHSFVGKSWFHFKRVIKRVWYFVRPSRKQLSHFMHPLEHWPAPKRLYTRLATWSVLLLMVTSINVGHPAYVGGQGVGQEYLALDTEGAYLTDEEGFLIKNVPLEGVAVYDQNRLENVDHEVQQGETLSVIAYRYGLNVSSIRYANPDLRGDFLKVGQDITIPPANGLYVNVKSGDTLAKLVDRYDGDEEDTAAFNELNLDGALVAGAEVFIVGGSPPQPVYTAPIASVSTGGAIVGPAPNTSAPTNPGGWIRPTNGRITQGYHGGHLAYDIADVSKPPIWAVADGVVVKASSGTWGGGYGNHIIIDHGNGYQTLYAHAEVLYVGVGETVSQGQVIAKMGRTGRVYGRTGIHLHFEISYNGIKQSPSILGVW